MITAIDKQACAERELKMRLRVYPRWVETGRMNSALADREIACMRAIVEDYKIPADEERKKGRLL